MRKKDKNTMEKAYTPVALQGSEGPWFNSNLGALPFPPLHFPSLAFPFPSSSPVQPLLLPRSGPHIQL